MYIQAIIAGVSGIGSVSATLKTNWPGPRRLPNFDRLHEEIKTDHCSDEFRNADGLVRNWTNGLGRSLAEATTARNHRGFAYSCIANIVDVALRQRPSHVYQLLTLRTI